MRRVSPAGRRCSLRSPSWPSSSRSPAAASSNEGDGASSSPQAKAYKIGITQIVTHPALDAAVEGFKQGLAEKGFTNVTYDDAERRGRHVDRLEHRAEVRQRGPRPHPGRRHAHDSGSGQGRHDDADRLHRRDRPGRRRPRDRRQRAGRQRHRRQRHAARAAAPRSHQADRARREDRRRAVQRRRGQLRSSSSNRRRRPPRPMGIKIVEATASNSSEVQGRRATPWSVAWTPSRCSPTTPSCRRSRASSRSASRTTSRSSPATPTASSVAPSPPMPSTTRTWACRPATWPPQILSGTPIKRHPRPVRARSCSSRSTRGRQGHGRDAARSDLTAEGGQHVLSRTDRRAPGDAARRGAVDFGAGAATAAPARTSTFRSHPRGSDLHQRTAAGTPVLLHGPRRVHHVPGAGLPRPDRRRQPAARRRRHGGDDRRRPVALAGDAGRRGGRALRRLRHRLPARAAQDRFGRRQRHQLRTQAARRHPHHDGAVHREPARHGQEQHAAARASRASSRSWAPFFNVPVINWYLIAALAVARPRRQVRCSTGSCTPSSACACGPPATTSR